MSKADEWLGVHVSSHNNRPRWESKGAYHSSAELYYRGPGYGPMVRMNFGEEGTMLLAAIDALSLGKWLVEMFEWEEPTK